jgi:hypothetical protein
MGERLIASSTSKAALDQHGPVITGVPLGEQIATTWEDRFFDGWGKTVAVFDLDYTTMEEFQVKRLKLIFISGLLSFSFLAVLTNNLYWGDGIVPNTVLLLFVWSLFSCELWKVRETAQKQVYSQHVCITKEGIIFVYVQKRKCSMFLWVYNRMLLQVKWDKILKITVERFHCGVRPLSSVTVSFRSKCCNIHKKMVIRGLKEPIHFQEMVQAMIRINNKNSSIKASSANNTV